MTSLPSFLGEVMNFLVAMGRVQAFLLCDEIDTEMIKHAQDSSSAL